MFPCQHNHHELPMKHYETSVFNPHVIHVQSSFLSGFHIWRFPESLGIQGDPQDLKNPPICSSPPERSSPCVWGPVWGCQWRLCWSVLHRPGPGRLGAPSPTPLIRRSRNISWWRCWAGSQMFFKSNPQSDIEIIEARIIRKSKS